MVLQGYLACAIGCSGPQQTSIFALVRGEKSLQDAVEEQLDFRLQLLLHLVLSCNLNRYRENFLCSLIQTYCEAVMASICHFVTTHFHPVLLCLDIFFHNHSSSSSPLSVWLALLLSVCLWARSAQPLPSEAKTAWMVCIWAPVQLIDTSTTLTAQTELCDTKLHKIHNKMSYLLLLLCYHGDGCNYY